MLRDVLSNIFYVDNMTYTLNHDHMIKDLYTKATDCLAGGRFRLHERDTNISSIGEVIGVKEPSINYEADIKILGYIYNLKSDSLGVKNTRLDICCKTKRAILGYMHSIFDPLGILTPILLNIKLLLRKICGLKLDWDEDIPESLYIE